MFTVQFSINITLQRLLICNTSKQLTSLILDQKRFKRQCLDETNSAKTPSFTGLCKKKSSILFFKDHLKSVDIYKKTGNKNFIIKKYIYQDFLVKKAVV